jgi:hypothetical protein
MPHIDCPLLLVVTANTGVAPAQTKFYRGIAVSKEAAALSSRDESPLRFFRGLAFGDASGSESTQQAQARGNTTRELNGVCGRGGFSGVWD